jgi:hypothetical protein
VSDAAPESDVVAAAISEILAEAARARDDGRIPAGREQGLDDRFAEIAGDLEALSREVAGGALSEPQSYRFVRTTVASQIPAVSQADGGSGIAGVVAGVSGRSLRRARGISRRAASVTRRAAGPRARAIERSTIDRAGRLAEAIATRGQVSADHGRRLATSGGSSRRLDRLSPGGRTLPSSLGTRAGRSGSGLLGTSAQDASLEALADWTIERLGRGPGGRVLHLECADGVLVQRLAVLGYQAEGADPAPAAVSASLVRAGAIERLGAEGRARLGGLVLSGVTERVSPGSARAIAHLASSRLRHGGVVVVVSSHPGARDDDPIVSDLAVRRPLHPVTWCHLLARYGFGEITVFDPAGQQASSLGQGLYGVAGRRR